MRATGRPRGQASGTEGACRGALEGAPSRRPARPTAPPMSSERRVSMGRPDAQDRRQVRSAAGLTLEPVRDGHGALGKETGSEARRPGLRRNCRPQLLGDCWGKPFPPAPTKALFPVCQAIQMHFTMLMIRESLVAS